VDKVLRIWRFKNLPGKLGSDSKARARQSWLKIALSCHREFFMSNLPQTVVTESAYLTLHYRLASMAGEDIVSTFNDNPATLQLGQGQLAPFLEGCLIGLPEGAHQTFDLRPEQAFGPRNPELIQHVSRATLDENSAPGEEYKIGDLVEFAAPGGGRFAGVLREMNDESALFDFNHPLAGQPVKFEVRIIGIL
jgi:FKBP-type peptidyl-prolyl cis-trans isomerase SlpA